MVQSVNCLLLRLQYFTNGPDWQGADRAFAKVFSFDSKGVVEAGTIILQSDCGRKFHEFRFGEPFAQARKHRVSHFHRSSRHAIGVLEDKPLQFREVGVCRVVIEIGNLPGRDAACPAYGRADIDSK